MITFKLQEILGRPRKILGRADWPIEERLLDAATMVALLEAIEDSEEVGKMLVGAPLWREWYLGLEILGLEESNDFVVFRPGNGLEIPPNILDIQLRQKPLKKGMTLKYLEKEWLVVGFMSKWTRNRTLKVPPDGKVLDRGIYEVEILAIVKSETVTLGDTVI